MKEKIRTLLKKHRRLVIISGIAGCVALFIPVAIHLAVEQRGNRISRNAAEIEARDIGLVLGTSRNAKNGVNLYFRYRIEAATELYFAGKVKKLLVSGDNGRKSYNEPEDMKQALIEHGVPAEDIVCDYAGFRTLDSIIRTDKIFGQKKFTIISRPFHCKRAIFLADHLKLNTIGFAARDVRHKSNLWSGVLREALARTAAATDLFIGRKPRYLGPLEQITLAPAM